MNYLSEGFIQGLGLIFTMNEEVWTAVITTLRLSCLSMAVTLALGVPMGFILGYFSFPGRRILRIIVDNLLSIPTLEVGLND